MLAYKCLSEFFFRWTYLAIRQVARVTVLRATIFTCGIFRKIFLHATFFCIFFCKYDLSNRFLDKNVAFIAPLQIFATLFEPNLIKNVAQLYVFSIMPHFYIFHMLNSSRAV